jgi:hypothetical protein
LLAAIYSRQVKVMSNLSISNNAVIVDDTGDGKYNFSVSDAKGKKPLCFYTRSKKASLMLT